MKKCDTMIKSKFQSILKKEWRLPIFILIIFIFISGCATTVGENPNISTIITDKKESVDILALVFICNNEITYEVKNNGNSDVDFVQVNISKIQTLSKGIESKVEPINNLKAGKTITKTTSFRETCGNKYEYTIHQEPYQKIFY
jgi:hypothetical protein